MRERGGSVQREVLLLARRQKVHEEDDHHRQELKQVSEQIIRVLRPLLAAPRVEPRPTRLPPALLIRPVRPVVRAAPVRREPNPRPAREPAAPEEHVEDLRRVDILLVVTPAPRAAMNAAAKGRLARVGILRAVPVVRRLLIRVGQARERARNLFEHLVRARRLALVRVELQRGLSVRLFDLVVGRAPLDAEDLVVVVVGPPYPGHEGLLLGGSLDVLRGLVGRRRARGGTPPRALVARPIHPVFLPVRSRSARRPARARRRRPTPPWLRCSRGLPSRLPSSGATPRWKTRRYRRRLPRR
mmetsp:Transcript_10800/g.46775  ORF Transcript_10800/g.46775 Transcript_10800/m.46775 type:complete len:300 (+) Transcript_10800:397-1296(+)